MESTTDIQFPRIAIKFCVQCKWNLRAAYYAQELLQTFSNSIGEISLIPVTGGIFTITIYQQRPESTESQQQQQHKVNNLTIEEHLIWDRKRDSGFPETKELKNRVRNVIDPQKDMGHVDRALKKGLLQGTNAGEGTAATAATAATASTATDASAGAESGNPDTAQIASSVPKNTDHAAHGQSADAAVEDCEECKEAAAAAVTTTGGEVEKT